MVTLHPYEITNLYSKSYRWRIYTSKKLIFCTSKLYKKKLYTFCAILNQIFYVLLDPPQIKIDRAIVPTGVGYESELKCTVTGLKKPEVPMLQFYV